MKEEGGRRREEGGGMNEERPRCDLRVRTKQFALRIIRLFSSLPTSLPAQVIGRQALRSGTSVGAHYRETCRARSTAEFVSKIEGGLQELEETIHWLELLTESDLVPSPRLEDLQNEAQELTAIFASMEKNAKRRKS
jgi:four helix bundle protein